LPNCRNDRSVQAIFTTFKLTYATSEIRYKSCSIISK